MRTRIWILALASFALIGCADEPPVTTTTTVTREVTTTGPTVATEPVGSDVYVAQAPPVVRVEAQTVAPGPGYIWTPGYWRWSGAGYVWVSGSWARPPRVSAVWVRGHWMHRARGWVWVPGHWR
jgi:hypothetical protein